MAFGFQHECAYYTHSSTWHGYHHRLRHTLSSCLGADITMAPGGYTDHPYQDGSGGSKSLRWSQVAIQMPSICSFPSDNKSHEHQPRPWLVLSHGSNLGPDDTMAPCGNADPTSSKMAPVVVWSSDTNVVTRYSPNPGHPCGL